MLRHHARSLSQSLLYKDHAYDHFVDISLDLPHSVNLNVMFKDHVTDRERVCDVQKQTQDDV